MHFFVAKLLSIAEMNYSYLYHLRNLRPMMRLIVTHTANKLQHATAGRAHGRIAFILPETRVPALHEAAIVLVYLYLILRSCLRKPRKNVQYER